MNEWKKWFKSSLIKISHEITYVFICEHMCSHVVTYVFHMCFCVLLCEHKDSYMWSHMWSQVNTCGICPDHTRSHKTTCSNLTGWMKHIWSCVISCVFLYVFLWVIFIRVSQFKRKLFLSLSRSRSIEILNFYY